MFKKNEFLATKLNGKIVVKDSALLKVFSDLLSDGQELVLSISKKTLKKQRSLEQNAYYWGVVVKILSDDLGYTPNEMHEAIKFQFLVDQTRLLPFIPSTTDLDTAEWESLMTRIREWASSSFNVYIPSPNEPLTL